jgi:C-methyltransferase
MTRTLDSTAGGIPASRPPVAIAQPQPQPHEAIWGLATAGFPARCLHVVADLGVADHIDDHAVPVGDLAARCGVAVDPLDRVLRLLATHGVFARQGAAYAHTPSSRLLRDDHALTMRPFAQMMGLPFAWGAVTELEHSVRTGRPSVETLEPRGLWAYLGEHADEAEVFGRAMTAKAAAEVAAVVAAHDFGRFATIADIGGGRGHLLSAVLDATPAAAGTLFDLPEVTATLDLRHPRMTVQGGDFFAEPLPVADAYLLMEILHDWADEECVEILRAVRRAAHDDSTLVVIEGVLGEQESDPRPRVLDLVMLTVTGGRERTAAELSALFEQGGFRLDRVVDTASPMRVVEASCV